MAKKSRDKFLEPEIIEAVNDTWNSGFIQSFLFHISLLLFLAFIVIKSEVKVKPIIITIGTSSYEEDVVIEIDSAPTGNNPENVAEAGGSDPQEVEIVEVAETPTIEPKIEEYAENIEETKEETVTDIVPDEKDLAENIVQEEKTTPAEIKQEKPSIAKKSRSQNNGETKEKSASDIIRGLGLGQGNNQNGMGGNENGMGGIGMGGNGDDFDKRLAGAGAQTGDIQISIAWDNVNDIDVGVMLHNNTGMARINYQNRMGPNMGMLDVDMNVLPRTNRAVENIFWPKGAAPSAKYTIYVHHYKQWCPIARTPVRIRIRIDGKIMDKQIIISPMDGMVPVFQFNYEQRQNTGPHLSAGHF